MTAKTLNVGFIVVGLIVMLTGLVVLKHELVATPLISVGASVLSTGLVNFALTNRLRPLPIGSIVEALGKRIEFMRMNQVAIITFSTEGNRVRLDKLHRYSLRNPSVFPRTRKVEMYTPAATSGPSGGFALVIEPDGTQLEGDALGELVTYRNGKYIFSKTYRLQPGDGNTFEFRSYEYFRMRDRLSWTVQDLSDDFRVRIINQTGVPNAFEIQIKHHHEKEIIEAIKPIESAGETQFEFNSELLPYQGFDVIWDLPEEANEHSNRQTAVSEDPAV